MVQARRIPREASRQVSLCIVVPGTVETSAVIAIGSSVILGTIMRRWDPTTTVSGRGSTVNPSKTTVWRSMTEGTVGPRTMAVQGTVAEGGTVDNLEVVFVEFLLDPFDPGRVWSHLRYDSFGILTALAVGPGD